MRILSGSGLENLSGFLHAGYTSASPRPLDAFTVEHFLPTLSTGATTVGDDHPGVTALGIPNRDYMYDTSAVPATPPAPAPMIIDTAVALRLQGEVLAPHPAEAPPVPVLPQSNGPLYLVCITLAFFSLLALFYRFRTGTKRFRRVTLAGGFATFTVAATVFLTAYLRPPTPPPPPPWAGSTPRAYADPELATRVIMHGLIGDALVSSPKCITDLAELVTEVSLPSRQLTDGQAYAIKTYAWDGWGHPFQLESHAPPHPQPQERAPFIYLLSSAGPDGKMATADDIKLLIKMPMQYSWDDSKLALFACKNEENIEYFYHRWNGALYHPFDLARAKEYAGSEVYDLVRTYHLLGGNSRLDAIKKLCDAHSDGLSYDPVFLIILTQRS